MKCHRCPKRANAFAPGDPICSLCAIHRDGLVTFKCPCGAKVTTRSVSFASLGWCEACLADRRALQSSLRESIGGAS